MLDEKGLRRPEFDEDESVPVTFGDGQDWYLPRPRFDVFASFSGGKPARMASCSLGPEYLAMIEALDSVPDDGYFVAVAEVAADLLRRNYNLSDSDLESLLRFRIGDDATAEWIGAAANVGNGRDAPKASAGGSA